MSNLFRTKWILNQLEVLTQAQCEQLYLKYLEQLKAVQPDSLALYGCKVYSRDDEDGIIEEIFRRLKIAAPRFVEIGCGDGRENNTHYMALKGSSGVWIDGGEENIKTIEKRGKGNPDGASKIVVAKAMVKKGNVVDLVETTSKKLGPVPKDLCDFLSVDVDGNDVYLCECIFEKYRPKVVCIEYNSILPPTALVASKYSDDFVWATDDYMGASLGYISKAFEKFDYRLVCCNVSGVNAYFVRSDLSSEFPSYSVQELYMPPRYNLLQMNTRPYGHLRTTKYLLENAEMIFFEL